jgi:acyl transferase domain-containing protein
MNADELLKSDDVSRVAEAEFAQPLCAAVQIALVNLLRTWGITPDAVVGHSRGCANSASATRLTSSDFKSSSASITLLDLVF